eukprot:1158289-Pelagomonas_calceolata.AAC.2
MQEVPGGVSVDTGNDGMADAASPVPPAGAADKTSGSAGAGFSPDVLEAFLQRLQRVGSEEEASYTSEPVLDRLMARLDDLIPDEERAGSPGEDGVFSLILANSTQLPLPTGPTVSLLESLQDLAARTLTINLLKGDALAEKKTLIAADLELQGWNSSVSAIILLSFSLLDLSSFCACRAPLSLNLWWGGCSYSNISVVGQVVPPGNGWVVSRARKGCHKEQATTGGRIPLWHPPIPVLRNSRACTPSLRLPAHSVRAHTRNLLKCWFPSSRKASSLTFSAGPLHFARHPACY